MKKLFAILLLPILVFPLWFMDNGQLFGLLTESDITVVVDIINVLIVPIWIAVVGFVCCRDNPFSFYCKVVTVSFFILVSSLFIGYAGWGLSTGKFLHPDEETVSLVMDEFFLSFALYFGLFLFFLFLRWLRKYKLFHNAGL